MNNQISSWKARNVSHGLSKNPLYNIHRSMLERCYNPVRRSYKNYGARGVSVCEEWLNSFQTFIDWGEANGYKKGLHLDRINNDGNYEPSNCRFVTPRENCRNTSRTIIIEKDGVKKPLIQWCEELDIRYNVAIIRYKKGWEVARLLNPLLYGSAIKKNYLSTSRKIKELARIINGQLHFFQSKQYIKALPTQEPQLYVGKYKGVPIADIEDLNYLEWAQKTLKLGASVRDAINYRIQSLQLTHR